MSLSPPCRIALILLAVMASRWVFIGLPLINFEWAFADVARYFETGEPILLERYFGVEANTLGMSILAYLAHQLLPWVEWYHVPRLIVPLGFVFLGLGLLRVNAQMGRKITPEWLLLVVCLQPVIWAFGGRGTADFFPAALAIFAAALLWDPRRDLAGALLLGVCLALKYYALFLLPLVALERLTRGQGTLPSRLLRCAGLMHK